ncbi:hypothetical protein ATANTOWER_029838 [Ataeniobius toweri]|uniref:Uncharacterized protein n=1 Tax=Ataeniobius toweri TaxID=208326 RepID=A0ABU7C457_9TELE|nr:hypothetical protein [Ataeniobius toweri]
MSCVGPISDYLVLGPAVSWPDHSYNTVYTDVTIALVSYCSGIQQIRTLTMITGSMSISKRKHRAGAKCVEQQCVPQCGALFIPLSQKKTFLDVRTSEIQECTWH